MATKKITWENNKIVKIAILDGVAKGEYRIDIEEYKNQPCCGLITIGTVGKTEIKIRIEDIPEYQEHYNQTPIALRIKRERLIANINGLYEDLNYQIAKWQEHGFERTMPNLDKEIKQAQNELKDFDIAYPEIIKVIKLENKQVAEQHMWD